MNPNNSISIVIPAKDEEKTIGQIIEAVKQYGSDVLVVDGHSKDKTADMAKQHGARVVLDNKIGKGDAIRVGLKEAAGNIIVFMDADGSHDPADIPKLIQPILDNQADLVMGSRMRGGSDELHGTPEEMLRLWGSEIITLAINLRFGQRMTDYQNGFRAIRASTAKSLRLAEKHTTIEQEMSIECLLKKFRVTEVPTHEYRRAYGDSHISLWRHGPRYVYSLAKKLLGF